MNKYTEAIQGDDVVILCDGIPMGVGEILAALNAATPLPADAALIGKLRHQLAQATDEAARLRALSQPATVAQVPEGVIRDSLITGCAKPCWCEKCHAAMTAQKACDTCKHAGDDDESYPCRDCTMMSRWSAAAPSAKGGEG